MYIPPSSIERADCKVSYRLRYLPLPIPGFGLLLGGRMVQTVTLLFYFGNSTGKTPMKTAVAAVKVESGTREVRIDVVQERGHTCIRYQNNLSQEE